MQQLSGVNRRGTLAGCAGAVVETGLAVSRLVRAELRRRHRPGGLTLPELRALAFVNADPACNPSQLAEYLMLTRPAVTRLLDGLVRRQLVSRRPDPGDRRRLRLALTRAGRAHLDSVYASARSVVAERLGALPAADRNAVERAMRLLLPVVTPRRREDG
ncbi:MAG: winged helix-turn-helix transcriptional regulator [Gemmatimonadota bacterium]|nr:winged helix-turn-helix transcriptional regulator [Gemmatimonadota bacterium]MDE3174301.1 winged helix-turn-helix transcriptional regulator [Gemmatimonadota bacterium]MDE3217070.1 winged helix-turn-helix transcriptional regulator [Gemmatimonadota bacterium]